MDVAGDWQGDISYVYGTSTHSMTLVQDDNEIEGVYRSQFASPRLTGRVCGAEVTFRALLGIQSNKVTYVFTGTAQADVMRGQVDLGEFGSAPWVARKTTA